MLLGSLYKLQFTHALHHLIGEVSIAFLQRVVNHACRSSYLRSILSVPSLALRQVHKYSPASSKEWLNLCVFMCVWVHKFTYTAIIHYTHTRSNCEHAERGVQSHGYKRNGCISVSGGEPLCWLHHTAARLTRRVRRKSYVHFHEVKLFIFTSRRRMYICTRLHCWVGAAALCSHYGETAWKTRSEAGYSANQTTHTVMLTQYSSLSCG